MAKSATTKGRPQGSKTADVPIVERVLPACPLCGSTNRRVVHTKQLEYSGVHNGQDYNRVVWRRCKCLDCEGVRVEKSFET